MVVKTVSNRYIAEHIFVGNICRYFLLTDIKTLSKCFSYTTFHKQTVGKYSCRRKKASKIEFTDIKERQAQFRRYPCICDELPTEICHRIRVDFCSGGGCFHCEVEIWFIVFSIVLAFWALLGLFFLMNNYTNCYIGYIVASIFLTLGMLASNFWLLL